MWARAGDRTISGCAFVAGLDRDPTHRRGALYRRDARHLSRRQSWPGLESDGQAVRRPILSCIKATVVSAPEWVRPGVRTRTSRRDRATPDRPAVMDDRPRDGCGGMRTWMCGDDRAVARGRGSGRPAAFARRWPPAGGQRNPRSMVLSGRGRPRDAKLLEHDPEQHRVVFQSLAGTDPKIGEALVERGQADRRLRTNERSSHT